MAKAKARKKAVAKKKPAPKKTAPKKALKNAAAPKKPLAKKIAPRKSAAATSRDTARTAAIAMSAQRGEVLGEITVPSGQLAIFDIGLLGLLGREALEPAIIKTEVPNDRALPVIGFRVGSGRYSDCWDRVIVKIGAGVPTHWRKLGSAAVDFARLICMDYQALGEWTHEDTLDGLADVVFWGRDAATAAKVVKAKSMTEGYGWTNLSLDVADERALEVDKLKAANHWMYAIDFRPHSHHFYALAEARKSKTGSGVIDVGEARVCLFFTSWGDGVYPVFLDLDDDNQPVQVRIQLSPTGPGARA